MDQKEILRIARRQSALDLGCGIGDFDRQENVLVPFSLGPQARRYYALPISCNFVSYGSNIVAASIDDLRPLAAEYMGKFKFYHCFEMPNMRWLNRRLEPLGHQVCFMAEYYLPELSRMEELPCPYPTRVLTQADFAPLYLPQWSNALCAKRRQLDVLGVGAYDGDQLIGLAGCSADCDDMWQIGIDVLPAYRRQGIASALTSRLAREILRRGKVPFYCSAWSNIPSVRNAVKSGFIPSWVEMSVKPTDIVDEMNGDGER